MTDNIKDTTKDTMRMGAASVHHSCQQTHREEIFCHHLLKDTNAELAKTEDEEEVGDVTKNC